MSTFLNISAPRLASMRARSCGVVTITAPAKKFHSKGYGINEFDK